DHILLADRVWFARFTGDASIAAGITALDQILYADFRELEVERAKMDDALERWVASLTEERLAAPLRYVRRGETLVEPLFWVAMHLFNHQTHHRGQVTTVFMQAGHDPGVTDLIAMLREEKNRP